MDPVTGPYARSYEIKGAPIWTGYTPTILQHSQSGMRQKKPYTIPTIFSLDRYLVTQNLFMGTYEGYTPVTSAGPLDSDLVDFAVNKTYGKFIDALGSASQWASNGIEAKKTLEGAVNAINTVRAFTHDVRSFNFSKAAKRLGVSTPRGVGRNRSWSSNWLEYHFGWEPLLQDIHAAMDSLNRDFCGPKKVAVRAQGTETSVSSYVNGNQRETTRLDVTTRVYMVGYVRVSDANANLLRELGLVNPASVAWEAVPFSFVVDWFANVGQVVSSFTDFVGMTITSSSTSVFQQRDWTYTASGVVPGPVDPPSSGPWSSVQAARSVHLRRVPGITGPSLRVRPFKGFSVVRGATAVALLLQSLK